MRFRGVEILLRDEIGVIIIDRNQPYIREMRIAVIGLGPSAAGHRMVKVIMQFGHLENGE
jgi:hypothetical protein